MKVKGGKLEFLYRLAKDGGYTEKMHDVSEYERNEIYKLNRLSISSDTWIASGFCSYVVRLKEQPMLLYEAVNILKFYETNDKNLEKAIERVLTAL